LFFSISSCPWASRRRLAVNRVLDCQLELLAVGLDLLAREARLRIDVLHQLVAARKKLLVEPLRLLGKVVVLVDPLVGRLLGRIVGSCRLRAAAFDVEVALLLEAPWSG
jgi:hypothetical protein